MPCACTCEQLQVRLLLTKCCCYLPLRVGCLLAGWFVVGEGLLVMCGYLELEGEDEKRRSNFTNGFAGAFLFLLGILVIGGVTEAKPLWLDAAALVSASLTGYLDCYQSKLAYTITSCHLSVCPFVHRCP